MKMLFVICPIDIFHILISIRFRSKTAPGLRPHSPHQIQTCHVCNVYIIIIQRGCILATRAGTYFTLCRLHGMRSCSLVKKRHSWAQRRSAVGLDCGRKMLKALASLSKDFCLVICISIPAGPGGGVRGTCRDDGAQLLWFVTKWPHYRGSPSLRLSPAHNETSSAWH